MWEGGGGKFTRELFWWFFAINLPEKITEDQKGSKWVRKSSLKLMPRMV